MKNPITKARKEFQIPCSCGCSILRISYWERDEMVFLEHLIPSFYARQDRFFDRTQRMIKALWCIITGKEYTFYEISLDTKKDVDAFKKFVAEINTEKLVYDE